MLQRVLERPLEKKAGRNYGPPGSKKMVYFVDDMNMPEVRLRDGRRCDEGFFFQGRPVGRARTGIRLELKIMR